MSTRIVIRGGRVVTPEGPRPASVHVEDGVIVDVAPMDAPAPAGAQEVDAGDLAVLPGLVDTHVHVNEPGRTEWEGFATATRAAAAGGVTTLLDMPLNSVPATTSVPALEAKLAAARGQLAVDVGFIGGVVPGNAADLAPLRTAGVLAFKCFLVPSGVPEFANVGTADLREALPVLARLGVPLMVHAELPEAIDRATAEARRADSRSHAAYVASRPPEAETAAIALVADLAAAAGAHVHIVHVSSAEGLAEVDAARARGVHITAETCPHYLTFTAADVPDGATQFKCAPPIREPAHRDALWAGLGAGTLDMVVSDHSPCPPGMKRRDAGDFFAAWGGIASLQLGLPVVWTGMRARGLPLERLARWMSAAPAALAGLAGTKGAIARGCDADLVFLDPDAEWTVDAPALFHRHAVTPYAGMRLAGRVERTYLRGSLVYDRRLGHAPPAGRTILHGSSPSR